MISETALEFYKQNKDLSWQMEPLPQGDIISQASWILNISKFGWLELDISIDTEQWQQEAIDCKDHLVPHREENNNGWNSCCIHGIDVDKTGAWTLYGYQQEHQVPYQWTSMSHKTPVIKKFWQKQFPADHYRRIRFMELEPLSAITPHSDMPGKLPGEENFNALDFGVPVNIAVHHPKDCFMVIKDHGIVPFQQGRAFIVNIRNYHSVINFSNESRIHVIGHPKSYDSKINEFAELVVRSYKKQYNLFASS